MKNQNYNYNYNRNALTTRRLPVDGYITIDSHLRRAIQLSNYSTKNITAAHKACEYWGDLLDDYGSFFPTFEKYDDTVLGLSLALYASCLVRVGKDAQAVLVLSRALSMDPNKEELILARAQAFQRLLRYSDARQEYEKSGSIAGILGSATCCLRLGDLAAAVNILKKSPHSMSQDIPAIRGLLGTLKYLESGRSQRNVGEMISSAARVELLYWWIQNVVLSDQDKIEVTVPSQSFLSLMHINLCPLDDPALVLLDDKVHLHRILSHHPDTTNKFWPFGLIVSVASEENMKKTINLNQKAKNTSLYILKERSGYGSHGNLVITSSEAMRRLTDVPPMSFDEEKLLQRMVDPPLLLHGRKFSLRIYVIYFSPSEVYLSPYGLVKLASSRMDINLEGIDASLHMTNSGRDVDMEQHDLTYLNAYLEKEGKSFQDFWRKIQFAVQQVLAVYQLERKEKVMEWDGRREGLGIPKIMGFDFVVDSQINPWLVEVNRFPGLEPRDSSDQSVKHRVVYDAWLCAMERHPSKSKTDSFQAWLQFLNISNTQHGLQRLAIASMDD